MRLEKQLAAERTQRDQLYRSHQEMQASGCNLQYVLYHYNRSTEFESNFVIANTHTHTRTRTRTHIYIHTYIHTYIYIHTCIYTQAKTELRHSQSLAGLQEEIDKARHEWEVERHRIYTRMSFFNL
jgi:hypothetical protein